MTGLARTLRLPRLGSALRARGKRWAHRRQGTDRAVTRLTSRRVYILPTGVGMVFALMTFAMLLGSMNYNNNLSFVLTFLLAGLGFVSMHQCQRNLVGLELAFAGAEPVFAGEQAEFRIAVTNHSQARRQQLRLYTDTSDTHERNLAAGESRVFRLGLPTAQRGYVHLHRYGIRSSFPFELFRAWTWLHMELDCLVYPRPADDAPPPPSAQSATGHRQHDARGEEDFAGFRRFQEGDSPRHVAWKAYARSGELLSKQFAGADTSSKWFVYDEVDAPDTEARLSVLTRWIVDADRTGRDYGLRLPNAEFPPAHGDAHRHRCLRALALFGTSPGSSGGA